MFLGTHMPRLDDKGRVILPMKFREPLAPGLVLTKGQDRCVVVWPADRFAEYANDLRNASLTSEKARGFTRVFFSSAFDDVPDKQGRVTVPPSLREYAGLDRELVVVGADTRIEIWDAAAWNDYLTTQERAFAEVDDEVIPRM
ncbi:MAG: transcriptional regulator MraZ [Actinobacteria bacterium]|nr:transcriptional regulator MraZ [Actinomycetota bacterium]